jgi:hypothetical protein
MPVFGQGDTQLDVLGSPVTWMALQLGCAEPKAAVPFYRAAEAVRGAFDGGARKLGSRTSAACPKSTERLSRTSHRASLEGRDAGYDAQREAGQGP